MTRINDLSSDLLRLAGRRMMSDDERKMLNQASVLLRIFDELVRAVESVPDVGVVCHDVDGVDWFELRAEFWLRWGEKER